MAGLYIRYPSENASISGSAVWGMITGTLSNQTDLQTALNLKAPLSSPTFTGTVTLPTTALPAGAASTVLTLDASKNLTSSAVTTTELGYVSGVTSAIQTQLNAKLASTGVGLVEFLSGFIPAPADGIYTLDESVAYAYTINTLIAKLASGTATAAISINGTPVTGISATALSSTQATGTASAANSVAIGNRVTLTLSSSSSPTNLAFTMKITRA